MNDEDLEKYTITYLHAYDTRRSVIDKMYEEALNNEFNNKIEPVEAIQESSKSMGFARTWILGLLMLTVSIAIFIFCIMISK